MEHICKNAIANLITENMFHEVAGIDIVDSGLCERQSYWTSLPAEASDKVLRYRAISTLGGMFVVPDKIHWRQMLQHFCANKSDSVLLMTCWYLQYKYSHSQFAASASLTETWKSSSRLVSLLQILYHNELKFIICFSDRSLYLSQQGFCLLNRTNSI